MSFKRHDIIEEYNVTADWLKDFARELEKKSYNIENLKNIRQMNQDGAKKFATIEEKMADIKQRIGFDSIKKLHEESGLDDKTAGSDCACDGGVSNLCTCIGGKISSASKKSHSTEVIHSMKLILNYIVDLCKHEHDTLSPVMVIAKCREESGLHFDEIPINTQKLNDFIEKTLKKYSKKDDDFKYVPKDNDFGQNNVSSEAEYWSHAFPVK